MEDRDIPRMINVLYFSNYAAMTKGGQRSLWYLLRDLDRTRFRPVLVCQEEGELTSLARKHDVPVEIVKLPRMRLRCLFSLLNCLNRFRVIFKRYSVDLAHSEELVAVVLFRVLKVFRPLAIIWHVRVHWDNDFHKKLGLRLADRIICVSKAVADSFPASPLVSVAHNGVDLSEYAAAGSTFTSDRFSDRDVLVGYFAALEPLKGPQILIQAAVGVVAKHPRVLFLMAGDGPNEFTDRLITMAREAGILKNIIFWGVEKNDTPGLMRRIDLFVLPSFTEGFSRSLLEAMALAKPVVVSDIPQNAEAIIPGISGLLAKKNDPADYTDKILRLLDDRDYARQLGTNARVHVAQHYTLQSTMKQITAVYDSLSLKGEND